MRATIAILRYVSVQPTLYSHMTKQNYNEFRYISAYNISRHSATKGMYNFPNYLFLIILLCNYIQGTETDALIRRRVIAMCCSQRTSSQQFYNLLYNKFATSQCQSSTSWHVKMLGSSKFLSVGGKFVAQQVVELLWVRPLWCCTTCPQPVAV